MTGFGIDPLIDGFVAEHGAAVFFSEFPSDDFRGPFLAEPGFNLGFESLIFKAGPAVTFPHSNSRKEFSMQGVVSAASEIAPKFPGKGRMRPPQSPADGSQRLAALKHHSKDFSFFFVQMCVGFHRPPFYPMKSLKLVVH
jgi:hypothetical protein